MKFNVTWNVCRVCLEEGHLSSIFEKDDNEITISDKIFDCANIKIERNSNLPEQICKKCVAYLNVAYKFRTICRRSDNILESFIQNSVDNKLLLTTKYTEPEEPIKIELDNDLTVYNSETDTSFLNNDESNDNIPLSQLLHEAQKVDKSGEIIEQPNDVASKSNKNVTKIITMESDGTAVIQLEEIAEQKPRHICEICGNIYTKIHSLHSHMRWHRNEKPYSCEICGASFGINFQLTRHMRTHTGQKPYECKYCGRKFADIGTKAKHERTHTGERPFKCSACGKTFTYSHVLNVHLKTHTGEKPFGCDQCGKRFSQRHHLKAHLNTQIHQSNPEIRTKTADSVEPKIETN